MQLLGKIIIKGNIVSKTGLHIGGTQTGIDIGGVDNSVIKDPWGRPYIPGSSLRGKLRNLLEKSEGLAFPEKMIWLKKPEKYDQSDGIRMHMCNEKNCEVCNIFGRNNGEHPCVEENNSPLNITNATPTRLLIRDAFLKEDSISSEIKANLDLEWTEVKFENSIDRITSAANPRQTERVPRGAAFDLEMIYNVFDQEDKKAFTKVLKAMKLLEDDYLGGGGSRGYGKVVFTQLKIFWNSSRDYEEAQVDLEKKEPLYQKETVDELLSLVPKEGLPLEAS